jgi:hypothetical protein
MPLAFVGVVSIVSLWDTLRKASDEWGLERTSFRYRSLVFLSNIGKNKTAKKLLLTVLDNLCNPKFFLIPQVWIADWSACNLTCNVTSLLLPRLFYSFKKKKICMVMAAVTVALMVFCKIAVALCWAGITSFLGMFLTIVENNVEYSGMGYY